MESHSEVETKMHGERLHKYLPEFVYGGIDGVVTTFAVVAGAAGANLDQGIVLILGFANLIADGFSMSVGAFLSAKSTKAIYHKHREREYWEIENLRESEVEEVRDIYLQKGFEGELLEQVVAKITQSKDRWVDTMMKEELEMIPEQKSPFRIGFATFISFIVVGILPLIFYVVSYLSDLSGNLFLYSSLLTLAAFTAIGVAKSYVTETSWLKAVGETLLLGVIAAVLAYTVGDVLEAWLIS